MALTDSKKFLALYIVLYLVFAAIWMMCVFKASSCGKATTGIMFAVAILFLVLLGYAKAKTDTHTGFVYWVFVLGAVGQAILWGMCLFGRCTSAPAFHKTSADSACLAIDFVKWGGAFLALLAVIVGVTASRLAA